jgi:glutamate dehydrogenase (NADP+)
MISNVVKIIAEGANMSSTNKVINLYMKYDIFYGPGKAAKAGGVSISGLEMSQNSMRIAWSSEEVNHRLKMIMKRIFEAAYNASQTYNIPLYYSSA